MCCWGTGRMVCTPRSTHLPPPRIKVSVDGLVLLGLAARWPILTSDHSQPRAQHGLSSNTMALITSDFGPTFEQIDKFEVTDEELRDAFNAFDRLAHGAQLQSLWRNATATVS